MTTLRHTGTIWVFRFVNEDSKNFSDLQNHTNSKDTELELMSFDLCCQVPPCTYPSDTLGPQILWRSWNPDAVLCPVPYTRLLSRPEVGRHVRVPSLAVDPAV